MNCINISHPDFKKLLAETGINSFMLETKISKWQEDNNTDNFPTKSQIIAQGEINMALKSVQALSTPKAEQLFKTLEKNKVIGETFWKKVQELGIPKEQIELLKSFNTTNREELITQMLANYSYTVEVNTAKTPKVGEKFIDREYGYELDVTEETLQNQINDGFVDSNLNTQYYSNLTVRGGTNYTENEIATPAITPSIKGHASFSTDFGIGWTRTDEKVQYTEQDIDNLIDILKNSGQLEIDCK